FMRPATDFYSMQLSNSRAYGHGAAHISEKKYPGIAENRKKRQKWGKKLRIASCRSEKIML
ncbi:MAG: hypothetical protein LUE90_00330, partial [Clostridiales bacterium]|nr:hypothetical protein [Clostridiales bacterium]